jgi:CRISPR-associated protein Csm5
MNHYRLTCLTPLLVGDGNRLAPIDYMVWRDQINVLDQKRIFRLLAKGPRLDSYLNQIRRVEKLDFASWGGYAQNFASRRIPLESPGLAALFERARPEDLFVPTFAAGPTGTYLPASALKGPLRTALLVERTGQSHFAGLLSRSEDERATRWPAGPLEAAVLGASGSSRTRGLLLSDSLPVASGATRIYLLRTATLLARGGKPELGWKQSPHGSVEDRRIGESTPAFAEMAVPQTVFTGGWTLKTGIDHPETLRTLRWKEPWGVTQFARAANRSAEILLELQKQHAERAGLSGVTASLDQLGQELVRARQAPAACLLCLGWGTGYLTKSALIGASADAYNQILRNQPAYARTLATGLPFPKTRRIVFSGDRPAYLPGWVRLDFVLPGAVE